MDDLLSIPAAPLTNKTGFWSLQGESSRDPLQAGSQVGSRHLAQLVVVAAGEENSVGADLYVCPEGAHAEPALSVPKGCPRAQRSP